MGHAHLENVFRFFVRRLYAKGSLSIAECAAAMVKAGEKLHASEGDYDEDYMLRMGLMDVIRHLTDYIYVLDHKGLKAKVACIVSGDMTDEQKVVYNSWVDGSWAGWDVEEYEVFDSIPWRYAPGVRKDFKKIPPLGTVTH